MADVGSTIAAAGAKLYLLTECLVRYGLEADGNGYSHTRPLRKQKQGPLPVFLAFS
jgi:hypothetical protein